tara:strand:- start:4187 stop:4489 length:303 start_codon:yes stop_codon:yes gene_type:complete
VSGKRDKKLRKKGRQILVEWLHSVIPDTADKTLINVDNLEEYLPEQTHTYFNKKFCLSAYSLRWIYKRVKRNPDLTFEQLEKDVAKEQQINVVKERGQYL